MSEGETRDELPNATLDAPTRGDGSSPSQKDVKRRLLQLRLKSNSVPIFVTIIQEIFRSLSMPISTFRLQGNNEKSLKRNDNKKGRASVEMEGK